MTEIRKTIVVLPGDHVGTEITTEAVKVLKAVEIGEHTSELQSH